MFISLSVILILFLVFFLAGLISGVTGFGFSLISVPILILFLSPKLVVPIVLVHSLIINFFLLLESKKWVNLKRIFPLVVAGIIGTFFGTGLLIVLNVYLIKFFVGFIIILFSTFFLTGFTFKMKSEKLAFLPVGFISGLLNGSITMSGPPIILFFKNQGVEKKVFRANLIAYFAILNLSTLFSFFYSNLLSINVLEFTILFLPSSIFGGIMGIKIVHNIREKLFNNLILITLIFAGLFLIISSSGIL
jgi:uncharacterized membrane protein YfcA